MPKVDHVLVEERGEPSQRAVVRVKQQLSEHAHLRRAVPPVRAVDEDRALARVQAVCAAIGREQE